jgi:hypothetical protein
MDQADASHRLFAQDESAPSDGPWWLLAAQERVAAGHNSNLSAAVWSVSYQHCYRLGLRDGHEGSHANAGGQLAELEGGRAGYAAGHRWGAAHPLPAREAQKEAGQ